MATLLVCGVGSGMGGSIATLRNAGHEVLLVNESVDDATLVEARDVFIAHPGRTPIQEILVRFSEARIDGVLTLGADFPEQVAALAQRLGLPGVPEEVARRCTRKDLRIAALAEAGLPVPRFAVVDSIADAESALLMIGYPAVVKPLSGTGSMGVSEIATPDELPARFAAAAAVAATETQVLVEQRLVGTEHTVGGLMVSGQFYETGFSDRDYRRKAEFHPHYFESGDTFPSDLGPDQKATVVRHVAAAAAALGIDDSVVNTDILVTDDGVVYILEVTCRLAGSRIATEVLPLATGLDPLPHVVRLALGQSVDVDALSPLFQRPVVQRFLPSRPGRVRSVELVPDSLREAEGVYDVFYLRDLSAGVRLPSYRDADDVIAGAIAWGVSVNEAENRALHALEQLPIVVDWD